MKLEDAAFWVAKQWITTGEKPREIRLTKEQIQKLGEDPELALRCNASLRRQWPHSLCGCIVVEVPEAEKEIAA